MRRVLFALLLVVCASRVEAQVAFDAQGTADCTQSVLGTTGSTCATLTVGSGANRAVVCYVGFGVAVSSVAVVWDSGGTNQSMALIAGATATNVQETNLWGLVAPTSGAKTLKVTWNAVTTDVEIDCVSYTGVNQTGGATSFPHGTSATGNSTAPSVTVTSATNNAVVAGFSSGASFTSVNNTTMFIDNTPASISGGANRAVGAATVAMSGVTSTGTTTWTAVGADIAAAGAATAVSKLPLLGVG